MDTAEQCRSCEAAIEWRRTKNDKWMPWDIEHDEPHWAHCPQAKGWKKQ